MLPGFLIGEKLYRVIFGAALFFAAYQAEVIGGGFQGVPWGQDEAAKALGLTYRPRMLRIILPQAFRLALPATLNQFVIALMGTSTHLGLRASKFGGKASTNLGAPQQLYQQLTEPIGTNQSELVTDSRFKPWKTRDFAIIFTLDQLCGRRLAARRGVEPLFPG